ncbi:hypothetical protein JZ751_009484 [Albula glossodonta]|uniref:V-SNARE coiled-coil homology domain-containing protein n=1 Tax=Albula glossodonta TaxID=121402 RepID=A0A8T2NXS6_9TELE|nr:hypothetical protein JZ751_009484 [Albula glossodonta]
MRRMNRRGGKCSRARELERVKKKPTQHSAQSRVPQCRPIALSEREKSAVPQSGERGGRVRESLGGGGRRERGLPQPPMRLPQLGPLEHLELLEEKGVLQEADLQLLLPTSPATADYSRRRHKWKSLLSSCFGPGFQVVDIMRVNVDKVLERDQKLSELDDRADALQAGASQFESCAAKLKNKYWWKNCKVCSGPAGQLL